MRWVGYDKFWFLWGPKSCILFVDVTIQEEVCFTRELRDIQDAWIILQ
jgi:hypothetical protein